MAIVCISLQDYLYLFIPLGFVILGIGLWLHKKWARAITIIITVFNLISNYNEPDFFVCATVLSPFLLFLVNPQAAKLAPLLTRDPHQPSAFTLAKEPGQWSYRFVIAGCFYIFIAFGSLLVQILPEQYLHMLDLPFVTTFLNEVQANLSWISIMLSIVLGNIFWIITGAWLLYRPLSARPVALAMTLTVFIKPIGIVTNFGAIPALSVYIIASTFAFLVLTALLIYPPEPPHRLRSLQITAIALIIIILVSVPASFVIQRYHAGRHFDEPFWGPDLPEAELPAFAPADYYTYELFGVSFALPWENLQITTWDNNFCTLRNDEGGLIYINSTSFYEKIYHSSLIYSYLLDSPSTLEQKSYTSPASIYSVLRAMHTDPPGSVRIFTTGSKPGFIQPTTLATSYSYMVSVYDQAESGSAEILLRGDSANNPPDILALAASLEFSDPAPANVYFDTGTEFIRQGDNTSAQLTFANACWLEPENPEYLYALAQTISQNIRDPVTAKRLLTQALAIRPGLTEAADLLGELGDLEVAHQDE